MNLGHAKLVTMSTQSVWRGIFSVLQISTYNVKPVISKGTLEASFSPDGMYVVSGESIKFHDVIGLELSSPMFDCTVDLEPVDSLYLINQRNTFISTWLYL